MVDMLSSVYIQTYTQYEKSLGMIMFISIKKHLSSIWRSTDEKLWNAGVELKKGVARKKTCRYFCILDGTESWTITVCWLN